MKKKVLLVVLVVGFIAVLSSCKGYRHATPCPAYTMEQPATNPQA
ncbi:MAG: hypothetical protein ABFS35_00670 [Bacteroidota bacterium]